MRPRLVVVGALLVAAAALGVGAVVHVNASGDSSRSGTGLTYEGRFYWASGLEVRPTALGETVARGVPFQDVRADVRRIDGFDPAVTLAALLPSLDGSPGGPRWTLVSVDQDRGTNPLAYAETRAVLVRGAASP